MTFRAILEDASKEISETGHYSYAIVYTDDQRFKVRKSYTTDHLTDDLIRHVATDEIARLERLHGGIGKREIVPGAEIALLTAAPPDEAAEAAQRQHAEFHQARRLLAALKTAAAEGLIAEDDKRLAETDARVKALWDDAYLANLARF